MGLKSEKTRSSLRNVQVGDAIPDSAVLRYRFNDDTDTTTITDSITDPSQYNGTNNGATYSNAIVDGFSLDFDGSDDYVEVPSNLGLFDNTTSYSISLWINPDDVSAGEQRIFHSRAEADVGITLNRSSNNKVIYYWYDGNTHAVESSSLSSGTSYHVGVSWDVNDGQFTLYIDGSPVDTNSTGTPNSRSETSSLSGRIDSNVEYYDGRMDEFILANEAWSDSQMADLYDSQK